MMANGSLVLEMDMESKLNLMELNIKETGKMINIMVSDYLLSLMEVHIRASGKKTKNMGMENKNT